MAAQAFLGRAGLSDLFVDLGCRSLEFSELAFGFAELERLLRLWCVRLWVLSDLGAGFI